MTLPSLSSAADAVTSTAAIVAAISIGELTPSEAAELSKMVEGYTRALEAAVERRLANIEKEIKK